jgi:hypothetical protein
MLNTTTGAVMIKAKYILKLTSGLSGLKPGISDLSRYQEENSL